MPCGLAAMPWLNSNQAVSALLPYGFGVCCCGAGRIPWFVFGSAIGSGAGAGISSTSDFRLLLPSSSFVPLPSPIDLFGAGSSSTTGRGARMPLPSPLDFLGAGSLGSAVSLDSRLSLLDCTSSSDWEPPPVECLRFCLAFASALICAAFTCAAILAFSFARASARI